MFGWAIVSKEKMTLGQRLLRVGMKGRDVRELQWILKHLGYYHDPIDGSFGVVTEEAVADLEKALGLLVDAVVGENLLRLLNRSSLDGGWIVHCPQKGETAKEIAAMYGISASVFGGEKQLRAHGDHALLIPQRNLWIWADEHQPEMACSGLLINALRQGTGDTGHDLRERRVMAMEEFFQQQRKAKGRAEGEWIVDGRTSHPKRIRRFIHRLSKIKMDARPWLWLSDMMLDAPGALTFLNLHTFSKRGGLIVEINPPMIIDHCKKIQPGYVWMRAWRKDPLLLSMNLRPRLDLGGERRIISPKEARFWRYQSPDQNIRHVGRFRWAMLPIRHGEEEGRLWFVDAVTMQTLYAAVVQQYRSGVVLEGIPGVDTRIVKIWRNYFTLGNIGHEITLRDIYLKRESI